jgi:hypothetical protein
MVHDKFGLRTEIHKFDDLLFIEKPGFGVFLLKKYLITLVKQKSRSSFQNGAVEWARKKA